MKRKLWLGLLIALVIAVALSPFASPHPDGLEKAAEDEGFLDIGYTGQPSPIPDYVMPGIKNAGLATSVAGLIGTLLTFTIMISFGKLVVARKKRFSNR